MILAILTLPSPLIYFNIVFRFTLGRSCGGVVVVGAGEGAGVGAEGLSVGAGAVARGVAVSRLGGRGLARLGSVCTLYGSVCRTGC